MYQVFSVYSQTSEGFVNTFVMALGFNNFITKKKKDFKENRDGKDKLKKANKT